LDAWHSFLFFSFRFFLLFILSLYCWVFSVFMGGASAAAAAISMNVSSSGVCHQSTGGLERPTGKPLLTQLPSAFSLNLQLEMMQQMDGG
jgi:hypothetical protein